MGAVGGVEIRQNRLAVFDCRPQRRLWLTPTLWSAAFGFGFSLN
jgi:hypothetical protein